MMSYANQKKYHIDKKVEEGDIFIMVRWDEYIEASKILTPSGLKLFMYLAKNQDGYEFYFSSKNYCDTFGVTDKTYRNARAELFEKGYLREGENNNVFFSANRAYKDTKEKVKLELKELGERLLVKDPKRGNDLKIKMDEADLVNIKNDTLYIAKAKELINFAQDMLKDIAESEINGLL